MGSLLSIAAIAAAAVGSLYQFYGREFIVNSLGIGRELQPIKDFPFDCRPLEHPGLQACEDLWLDGPGRALYAACSTLDSRRQWTPAVSKLNASGRNPEGDAVFVIDLAEGAELAVRKLKVTGLAADAAGESKLSLHGFDVDVLPEEGKLTGGLLRFWMINHRPPLDEAGDILDPHSHGANSTIEVFDVPRGGSEMVHRKTITDADVHTPNEIASDGDGGFLVTNDHSGKLGFRRNLDPLLGGGSVAYCRRSSGASSGVDSSSSSDPCDVVVSTGFNFPNGISRGADGLYYVASSFRNKVRVMELVPSSGSKGGSVLVERAVITLGTPQDNLSVDDAGDVWAAGIAKITKVTRNFEGSDDAQWPSTVWRIRRLPEKDRLEYEVIKILEDRDREVIEAATTVVHDVKSGKLFISGVLSKWVTVCEPKV